jgi:hypothetical protein
LRIPGAPELGMGYVQSPGGGVVELERVDARERVGSNGLRVEARLELTPPGLALDVEPVAFGPLRLEAPDGRVTNFPRAMCRVRAADGREGLAWVEWNLNRREPG